MTHEHEVEFSAMASDHALYPRPHRSLENWSGHARIKGPCGDTMEFWVDVEAGRVRRASFATDGCGSARACGAVAARLSENRTVDDALALAQADILEALGGLPAETEHCALLAANTLHAACRDTLQVQTEARAPAHGERRTQENTGGHAMRIAIPVEKGALSAHFGHCQCFALIDVDTAAKRVVGREDVDAPPHEPGLLPAWLAARDVDTIIAGGMGRRAQDLFSQHNIQVIVGTETGTPEALVEAYLAGTLATGANACDH